MPCASCDLLSLEFAVNLRWALSYATSRLDPTTEQHYAVVLQHLPTLEAVLSSSFAHISHAAALPFGAVEVSRSAVLHLLLAESLLGASPPTMHAFLLRATATPENSARSTVAHECGGAAARTTSSTSSTTTQSIHLSSVPFSARSARDVRAMGDVASSALTRGGPHTAETQSMLMLIRWLLVENILHVDELAAALEVPLDDLTISKMHADTSPTTTTPPSSSSVRVSAALGSSSTERKTRFATHVLMATRMAQSSPFYLGAHIVLSRALLLHYANHLLRTEDVMCHVCELSPAEWPDVRVAEVASVEEALSAWLVSVLQMSHTATTCAGVAPHVLNSLRLVLMRKEDGLYAALMDGVALSVVLHFYHPEMMPLERIHAPTHNNNNNNNNIDDDVDDDDADVGGTKVLLPQREAVRNWSAILRCAEILGLNASLVAVEVAQHGCTTLRIHLLRFVEELFAVLATDAEESVRVTMEQQQQQQQQHVDDDDDDDDVKKSGNVGLSSEAQRSLRASYDRSSASSSTHRRSAPPSSTTRAQPTSATTTTPTPSSSSPAAQPTSSAAKTQHAMPQSYTAHPMVLRPTPTPTSTVVEEHNNNNKNNASAPSRQIYVAEGGVDAKEDGRRLPISAALVPLRDDELVDVLNVGGDAQHADEDEVLRLMGQPQRVRAVRCGDATRTTTTTSTPPPPSLTSLLSSAAQHVTGVRTQPPTCAVMAPRMQHLPPPPPLQRQLNHISTAVALIPESCLDEVVVADVVARATTDVEVVLAAQSSETTPLTLADSPVARRITTTSNNNNNMMMMIAPTEAAVELFEESCGDIPPRRSTTVAEVSDLIRNNTAEEVMMMAPLSIEHGSTTNTASMPNKSSPRRALVRDAVDAEEGSTKRRHQIQYSSDVVVAKVNDDDGDGDDDDDVIDVDDETLLLRQMPTSMLPQGHSPLPTNPSPIDVADDDDDGSSPHTRSPHTPEEVDVSPFLPPSSASLSPVMGSELPSLFSSSRRSHARDDESWFSSVSQPRGGQHNNNNNNNTLSSSSSYRQRQRRSAAMIDELIVQLASIDLASLSEEERESLRNVVAQQHAHIQHASKNNNNNNNNTHGEEEEEEDDDDGTQPRRELSSSRGGPTPLSIMREGSYFDEPSEADLRRRRVAFRDVYPPGALDRMCGRRSTRASSAGSIATVERMGSVASARFSDGASQLAETEVSSIATRRLAMESP